MSEQQILIIGAGGHAQVVADILLCIQQAGELIRPTGFLDDDDRLHGKEHLGLPVMGGVNLLPSIPHDGVIVAIGNNQIRARIYDDLTSSGENIVSAIHPQTTIARDVEIAPGCMLAAGVIINTGSRISANTILNTGATVDHHNTIGAHCHIAPGVNLGGDVTVGEGALIGLGASVMPQRTIGVWATVGAGALVDRDIAPNSTVVGVPARPTNTNPTA